jgi:hypothetical protein
MLLARKSRIDSECPDAGDGPRCSSEGRDLIDGTTPFFVLNAISWAVAIGGLGSGTVLLVVASSGPSKAGSVANRAGSGVWITRFW